MDYLSINTVVTVLSSGINDFSPYFSHHHAKPGKKPGRLVS
jgi:hypothetical protein